MKKRKSLVFRIAEELLKTRDEHEPDSHHWVCPLGLARQRVQRLRPETLGQIVALSLSRRTLDEVHSKRSGDPSWMIPRGNPEDIKPMDVLRELAATAIAAEMYRQMDLAKTW